MRVQGHMGTGDAGEQREEMAKGHMGAGADVPD